MRDNLIRSGLGISIALMAFVAVAGPEVARTAPLGTDPAALGPSPDPMPPRAGASDWLDAVTPPSGRPADGAEGPPMVRLRLRAAPSKGSSNEVDSAVFGAPSRKHPITDVYDMTRVDTGKPAPITPVEIKQKRKPDPSVEKRDKAVRSPAVVGVGIKTLNYLVDATRIFVENLSRILRDII